MKFLAVVPVVAFLVACAPGIRVEVPPTPASPVTAPPILPPPPPSSLPSPIPAVAVPAAVEASSPVPPPLEARSARIAALEGEMATLRAEKQAAEEQATRDRQAAALAPVLAAATWGTWAGAVIAGLAGAVAVVLAILRVPLLPRVALAVAVGGVALVAIARGVASLVLATWWPLLGLGVVLAGASVAALWCLSRWWASHQESWRTAREAVAALANAHPVAVEAINRGSLERQPPGVRSFNDAVLARL